MGTVKKVFNHVFVDGLSGMALGLFATLIIGTIISQVALFVPEKIGYYFTIVATIAKVMTGAGIGVGISVKYSVSPLVAVSTAVAGLVGAFASKIIAGTFTDLSFSSAGPGEPLGAFIAAMVAVEIGRLVSGKTKLDIILTPAAVIAAGSVAGLLIGPPISKFMTMLGNLINWGTENQPIIMGIVVAVIMGIVLTLPISSAALAIILNLSGIAGGAAVAGCCAQMVGFAVSSYRENKFGGLVAQGIGTSMLQMPNIVRRPQIWLGPIIASAIIGPISTTLGMTCLPSGAGMGTSGLVGQIMTFNSMSADGVQTSVIIIEMVILHFIAPAVISLIVSEGMRKLNIIKFGDMELKNMN